VASVKARLTKLETTFRIDPLDTIRGLSDMHLQEFVHLLAQGRAAEALRLLGLPPGLPLDCTRAEAWLAAHEASVVGKLSFLG
jgi:hypothetical protein